jgi:uncharacterized membrane protein YphA (DoxX/SURF4 family)/peroxiredoxin
VSPLLLILRYVLVVLFAIAAVSKLADRTSWRETVLQLGLTPRIALPLVWLVPAGELGVAAAIAAGPTSQLGAIGAAVMLSTFAVAIWIAVSRGRTPECNCFGQLGSSRLSWSMGARNLLLAAIAVLVAWNPVVEPSTPVLIGAAVGTAFAIQSWFCFQLLRQNGRVLARVEALESKPRAEPIGLPVGAPAPNFVLDDAFGRPTSLAGLGGPTRSVLLAFVDPHCASCSELLPELTSWQRKRPDLALVFLTSGDLDQNQDKFVTQGISPVLVQRGREVAMAYGVPGTPAAVLVGPDGLIGSPVAFGPAATRALIDGVPDGGSDEPIELRPAVGGAAIAAGVGAVLVGASSAVGQTTDPGIEEIRAKLAAATPTLAADLKRLQGQLKKFLGSRNKHPTPTAARAAIGIQRKDVLNLQAELVTVTAVSAQAQAVRDAMESSLGYHVQALEEFDHMLGLRGKSEIGRSKKKAFKLLEQARTNGYYANVGLGCTGKEC